MDAVVVGLLLVVRAGGELHKHRYAHYSHFGTPFYSCFASKKNLGKDVLGIPVPSSRPWV